MRDWVGMWWYCGDGGCGLFLWHVCAWGWVGLGWVGLTWWYLGGGYGLILCGVRLVFVGKPACSHICHLGVVGIEGLVFEHYFSRLFCLFSLS